MVVRQQLGSNRGKRTFKEKITPFLFLLPHLLPFFIFFFIPILVGIYASFTDWKLGKPPVWEGLANFKTLLFDNTSMFYYNLRWGLETTLKFVVMVVPFQIIVPLMLAVALNAKPRAGKFFQSLYYVPALLSIAVVMTSWSYMFDQNAGFINFALNAVGLEKVKWMTAVPQNMIAITIITVW